MAARVEFFFDLSSPWTRLAFRNIQPLLAEAGASAVWRPFLVGGVFNAVNPAVYASRSDPDSPRMRHAWRWLHEWADLAGVAMTFPSPHHPLKSVLAMRACCALEADQPLLAQFAEAAFEAYFGAAQNLDDPAIIAAVAASCGVDGAALVACCGEGVVKDRLRCNTDEAIARGAFGSPTIFADGVMYFGNDQLPLVRAAMLK